MAYLTLANYLNEVRLLLHDAAANFYTDADLTDYINRARAKVAGDTGCLRVLQTVNLTQGVEFYSFGQITNVTVTAGGTGYANSFAVTFTGGGGTGATATATAVGGVIQSIAITNNGTGFTSKPTPVLTAGGGANGTASTTVLAANTLDVWSVNAIFGGSRFDLGKWSFSQLNAQLRSNTTIRRRPMVFANYGEASICVGPNPDQTYVCEFDTTTIPATDLALGSDVDIIPYPFSMAVPYWAVYLARQYEQDFEKASLAEKDYRRQLVESRAAKALRIISNPYSIGV